VAAQGLKKAAAADVWPAARRQDYHGGSGCGLREWTPGAATWLAVACWAFAAPAAKMIKTAPNAHRIEVNFMIALPGFHAPMWAVDGLRSAARPVSATLRELAQL